MKMNPNPSTSRRASIVKRRTGALLAAFSMAAATVAIQPFELQLGILDGLLGSDQGILGKGISLASLFAVKIVQYLVIFKFTGEGGFELGSIGCDDFRFLATPIRCGPALPGRHNNARGED